MEIVITIQHPAHVHFFRNAITELEADCHSVHVFVRVKEHVPDLLKHYNIEHEIIAGKVESKWDIPRVQAHYEWQLFKKARQIDPDVMMAIGEPGVTHVSKLVGAKSILFVDTEHSRLQKRISIPFADRVYTPGSFRYDLGDHQQEYPGYHELAYLHPSRFDPDPCVFDEVGLDRSDRFVILRTVDWSAMHDIGDSGFANLTDVVESLEEVGVKIFITAEGGLPTAVEEHQVNVEPHQIHHLMYYADLFIGESATMATESAVLGTPSIFVSSSRRGYTDELENRYGLVSNFSDENRQSKALKRSISILEDYEESKWTQRRQQLLEDKIDTTTFIIDQIGSVRSPT